MPFKVTVRPSDVWEGLSTDEKPTPADGVISLGASLLETDTGRVYHWTGTRWAEDSAEVQELRQIRSLLSAVLEHLTGSL